MQNGQDRYVNRIKARQTLLFQSIPFFPAIARILNHSSRHRKSTIFRLHSKFGHNYFVRRFEVIRKSFDGILFHDDLLQCFYELSEGTDVGEKINLINNFYAMFVTRQSVLRILIELTFSQPEDN